MSDGPQVINEQQDTRLVQVIEPPRTRLPDRTGELWRNRHLLLFFASRSVRNRYKETVLGWLWLIIRPLVPALLFATVFGELAKFPSEGLPYMVFLFPGLGLWGLFSFGLLMVTRSLRANRRLLTKLYFPRIIVPLASLAPCLVEFLVHTGVFVGILLVYLARDGVFYLGVGPRLLAALAAVGGTCLLVLGFGLWTSVLNAQARDVRMTLPYVVQLWFFATPVLYPLSFVPAPYRAWAPLNPMAALVELFRWGLFGKGGLDWTIDLTLAVVALTVVVGSGLWFFYRYETRFVDSL